MSARDEYIQIFGELKSLDQDIPWTTGLSNMFEWLAWYPENILGVSKSRYQEIIIELCKSYIDNGIELEGIEDFVEKHLNENLKKSAKKHKYDKSTNNVANCRELLRRAKYFSEDYLNKEFDIFMSLVSDRYLDCLYNKFTPILDGGRWNSHGNGGLFFYGTDIQGMSMDNLSYSPHEKLLVANELKLGGKKNSDQILKYSLMIKLLKQRNFIKEETRLLLIFFCGKDDKYDWNNEINKEIEFCNKSTKSTAKYARSNDVVEIARNSEYGVMTWNQLLQFNEIYLANLNDKFEQVEKKLLWGFNETLRSKDIMSI